MTAAVDFPSIDQEHRERAASVAGDWFHGDDDYQRFVGALMQARRGPLDDISQNDVRPLLTEATVAGRRIAMNPRRYSALWARAVSDGFLTVRGFDTCTTSTSGNNGKWQRRYRWAGGPPPAT
ncbi:hypothetical protein QE370_000415 [Aeromicrobium sp. SORGH_AS981]|uniref:hypothetical protein n=1 Tax=Aeromicrobium sp. SORGH_AS_0981 TaxID=3041802 RepID=UPI00286750E7|nr:hypothetical protein [Aeromicrobium sp. SORGH_AS_0981]MDR6117231.1 hypothetical protein [Aeromicrobium sp. SORGH_AS_0981]